MTYDNDKLSDTHELISLDSQPWLRGQRRRRRRTGVWIGLLVILGSAAVLIGLRFFPWF